MKSDGNGRSHTHFYVREHGADSRTQADKKGEKQRTETDRRVETKGHMAVLVQKTEQYNLLMF